MYEKVTLYEGIVFGGVYTYKPVNKQYIFI